VTQLSELTPVSWWACEPRRLAQDQAEVAADFPELSWRGDDAGSWLGRLPRWPFARLEPEGLEELVGDGMPVVVVYGHAYPMVPPAIYPRDPEPDPRKWTDAAWHVMGDGSLCLIQDDAMWSGRDRLGDLLRKAAGWRVEYALMTAGLIDKMSLVGIVEDDTFDHLVTEAAARKRVPTTDPSC